MINFDTDNILNRVKASLMIPAQDKFVDEEIKLHIASCITLLSSMGASDDVLVSDNPLVVGLVMIYTKTFFGFKNDGSVRELPSNFHIMARQLVLSNGGR